MAIQALISESAVVGGPYVRSFENEFAEFCGVAYCCWIGNGTDALFIVFRALGIAAGDEVIKAANSLIATSEAIIMSGSGGGLRGHRS